MSVWYFLTPVLFSVEMVADRPTERQLVYPNPMSAMIVAYQRALLDGSAPKSPRLAYSAIFAVAIFIVGTAYFRRSKDDFEEALGSRRCADRNVRLASELRARTDADWVRAPIDELGSSYDRVKTHGWYRNLEPTVAQIVARLPPGDVLIDYSGGTGILVERVRRRIGDRPVGIVIVDASPKFLRVALARHQSDSRVAFRLLRSLPDEQRLQRLEEVLDPSLLERGADLLSSTNAVHLYPDLPAVLGSWRAALRPGGAVLINSGNIRNPAARPGEWIIDETVSAVTEVATNLVRSRSGYAAYMSALEDPERMRRHIEFRDRVFPPPRPLDLYVRELERAGFRVDQVNAFTITVDVAEWFEFLRTYHEAVLGWVGGSARIDGAPPTAIAVDDRLELIRESLAVALHGERVFPCCWTYISASR